MRSVHMKLVMILVLLILSLMTVVGAFLIGICETLTKAYISSSFADAIVFGILIVVLIIRPSGLLGVKTKEKV